MAGQLKRERSDQDEAVVLLTALRDSNLPKFLADDAILFEAILSDLFPGLGKCYFTTKFSLFLNK